MAILIALFTLLIIAVLLTTTSIAGWRSRMDVTRDTQTYQAFLAADSGLSSFVARLKESGFSGRIDDVACWVQGESLDGSSCTTSAQLGTLYLSSSTSAGPQVDVLVKARNDADSTVTVQSTGRLGTSARAATSTLTQNIKIKKPAFMNFSPQAALTSCSSVSGGGSARLGGQATTFDGVIYNVTTATAASPATVSAAMASGTGSASGWPATLSVLSSEYLASGSYIRLGTQGYTVTAVVSGTRVAVTPSDPLRLPREGTSLTGAVDVVLMAVRSSATSLGASRFRIPVSDPTSVYPNDTLYVDSGSVSYGLTAVSKGYLNGDTDQGYVDVTLGAAGAGAFTYNSSGNVTGSVPPATSTVVMGLLAGTPVRRYVPGATSSSSMQGVTSGLVPASAWSGSSVVSPAATAGNTNVSCGESLFAQVFNGITKQGYYDLTPAANRLSGINRPLNRDLFWMGPPPGSAPGSYTLNGNDLCGYGILVINGNLSMKGTGNLNTASNTCMSKGSPDAAQGFTGVIYVTGTFSNQGNSVINGAVVVEGGLFQAQTSLGGSMQIQYSPLAVLTSARALSPLSFSYGDGTWSQQ
ncbi:hypothetical protein [Deinococcus frigens]|uniref:hypothetical protein n=1 Tax=Deinococcus frigens TaxID=249403 RepID=UPI0005555475|nr:hypothetical protein [Deinococcus frigens]